MIGEEGPWVTRVLCDLAGSCTPGFAIALVARFASAAAIWRAASRKVRVVAGYMHRLKPAAEAA